MQVWQDESGADPQAAMIACGNKTGLSATEEANAGVTITGGGTPGLFTFATSGTDENTNTTATITDGFKMSTATSSWTMQACSPKSVTANGKTYNMFACGPDAATNGKYQANLGGGCVVTATNAAVKEINWSNVSWGSCTNSAGTIPGFYKNSCSGTYTSNGTTTAITCGSEFGVFSDVALTTPATQTITQNGQTITVPANFDHSYLNSNPVLAQGANCSTATTELAKVNCYAQYYEMYGRNMTGCLPRLLTDWSQTDAAKFAKIDFRPQSLVFMEKLTYADSNSASMLTKNVQQRGVRIQDSSGNSNWINCEAIDKGGLSLKRISPTKILAKYVSATFTTSVDKAACVAASWNGQKESFLFYLTK
jgi:hypothetical protein